MKMSWKSFVSGMVLGSVLFSGISYAAPKVVKLVVNGNDIHSEVAPQIIDGSTMIPARAWRKLGSPRILGRRQSNCSC